MRWISDRQSAENREVSVLALIETVLAGIAAYFIYHWQQTTWHFAVAACLAPFLLLRTDRINSLSFRMTEKLHQLAFPFTGSDSPPISETFFNRSISILMIPLPVTILVIKFAATISNLFAHPLETIGEIPRNWDRVVLCTDTGAIPELIPTIERVPNDNRLHELKASALFVILLRMLSIILNHLFAKRENYVQNTKLPYFLDRTLSRILGVILYPFLFTVLGALWLVPPMVYRILREIYCHSLEPTSLGSEAGFEPNRHKGSNASDFDRQFL